MIGVELTYFTWHLPCFEYFSVLSPLLLITAIVPLVCYNKMAQKTGRAVLYCRIKCMNARNGHPKEVAVSNVTKFGQR